VATPNALSEGMPYRAMPSRLALADWVLREASADCTWLLMERAPPAAAFEPVTRPDVEADLREVSEANFAFAIT
jgi:hypothetical protein